MTVQQAQAKTRQLDGIDEHGFGQRANVLAHEMQHLRLNIGPAPLFGGPELASEPRVLSMKYAGVKHSPEFFADFVMV